MRLAVGDPCAGEGKALVEIARFLVKGREAADARNAARAKAESEEWQKAYYKSEKMREKAIAKAEARFRSAERSYQNALVAAGLAPPIETPPPVAVEPPQPVAVEPDDDDDEDDDEEEEEEEDPEDPVEVVEVEATPRALPDHVDFYTVEMEQGRHKVLSEEFGWKDKQRALHGDAFCATFTPGKDSGVGLLYLNPPYDLDKVCGRLEEKFLRRFTDALAPGGVLVFLVPYHALSASVDTLARRYEDVACYRFAGAGFDVYKQVVVFAKKLSRDRMEIDPEIAALVRLWAEKGAECPELPDADRPHRRARYAVPMHGDSIEAITDWKIKPVDAVALLAKFKPWHETTRKSLAPISRVVPGFPLVDVMHRTYEVATPPRPAHIAAGLAAGLFNGQKIEPDDRDSKLPSLLVKGCFDREWRTVEEKHNKDGDKTGEVQVQTPKLVITILDLKNHTYHTLRQDAAASAKIPKNAADLSVGDLLSHYGRALMSVMDRQCVILYDPRTDSNEYTLVPSPRELFAAQAHAVKGILTVLDDRGGVRQPILIGEIGSGKSTVALVAARSHGAKRVLVFCPPHLLDSWRNEVKAVFPDADYRVLTSVVEVDEIKNVDPDRFLVAVVSREVAKLGHRLAGVSDRCPKCGDGAGFDADEIAKKRARCEAEETRPENDYAKIARALALQLRPHARKILASQYLPSRLRPGIFGLRQVAQGVKHPDGPTEDPTYIAPTALIALAKETILAACKEIGVGSLGHDSPLKKALSWAIVAGGASPETILDAVKRLQPKSHDYSRFAESLLLLLPAGGALGTAFELLATFPKEPHSYGGPAPSATAWFKAQYAKLSGIEKTDPDTDDEGYHAPGQGGVRAGGLLLGKGANGGLTIEGHEIGSVDAAGELLKVLGSMAAWSKGPVCGEPLYQSTPDPKRYPLAKYIVKHHRKTFDFVILDECHEAGNADSAQSTAAHRLTSLRLPSILMTGTIMNGYAESLFANFWGTDMEFREEFGRREESAFVDRYGYKKRLVTDKEDGKIVAYGSQSDRVERSEKDIGSAPGVLPLFLFNHLLKGAVTLHKADLRIDLPALSMERAPAVAEGDLLDEFQVMVKALVDQIKEDRFDEELSGKLFGQLSELPSYLDRATIDVGNGYGKEYEVRYPESVGGELVTSGRLFPKNTVLPKEALMLDLVEREIKEGRRAMVFGWHTEILPRLARLLQERLGEDVPILYASKVPTAKRQAWIDKNIVGKNARVMVTNPVCIQTGLNNLVWFQTIWQHENPACNPITDRQSIGRIDRIGQKLPTRVYRAYYEGTLQEKMYDLLMQKVTISTAVDGLDPESAMLAAGIEPDTFVTGLSLGKALWAMIEEGIGISEKQVLRVVRGGR